jgi:hypothetical protein
MCYNGYVKGGVVVFEGPPPPEGTPVRVEEISEKKSGTDDRPWGEMLKDLTGSIGGPTDMAAKHGRSLVS